MASDELLLKITEKGSTEVVRDLDKVADGIDDVNKSEKKLAQSGKESTQAFNKQQASIISTNQALDLFSRGLNIAKGFVEESIGSTLEYSKQVRDLSTNLGISVEETSKIIQASDDYGISVGEVTSALQMAVKKGYAPNIDTLAKLADEYNSISDPVERAARLTEVFGRNWTALTPMLKEGGQAIRDAAEEAEKMGLVLSDKDVKAARALEIAIDNLNDRVEALKLKLGNALIPVLSHAADVMGEFIDIASGNEEELNRMIREREYLISLTGKDSAWVKRATAEIDKYTGEMEHATEITDAVSRGERRAGESAAYWGRLLEAAQLDEKFDASDRAARRAADGAIWLNDKLADLKIGISGAIENEMEQYNSSQDDLQQRLKDTAAEIKKLEREQGKVDKTTDKNAMSTAELAQAQARLASTQARLAKETDPNKQRELAASIAVQQEKIDNANQSVVTYVDNSEKIADLKATYDDINKSIEENAKKHEEATNRIIYGYAEQQLAIDGFTENEFQALDALAVKLGIKSEKDVAAFKAIRGAAEQLAKDQNVNKFVYNVVTASDKAQDAAGNIVKSLYPVGNKLDETALKALNLMNTLGVMSAQTYSINIVERLTPSGSVPINPSTHRPTKLQHGGDFIVPPGFPNDTYRINVSSGERVQVAPQGRGMSGNVSIGDINITVGGTNASTDAIKEAVYSGIVEVFQGAMR